MLELRTVTTTDRQVRTQEKMRALWLERGSQHQQTKVAPGSTVLGLPSTPAGKEASIIAHSKAV